MLKGSRVVLGADHGGSTELERESAWRVVSLLPPQIPREVVPTPLVCNTQDLNHPRCSGGPLQVPPTETHLTPTAPTTGPQIGNPLVPPTRAHPTQRTVHCLSAKHVMRQKRAWTQVGSINKTEWGQAPLGPAKLKTLLFVKNK